jgi:hypothetical protein
VKSSQLRRVIAIVNVTVAITVKIMSQASMGKPLSIEAARHLPEIAPAAAKLLR